MNDNLRNKLTPHLPSLNQAARCEVIHQVAISIEPMHAGASVLLRWESKEVSFTMGDLGGTSEQPLLDFLESRGWMIIAESQEKRSEAEGLQITDTTTHLVKMPF